MSKKSKGIAPLFVILLIALGLIGGATAGYEFREPIKKALEGKNTADEIKDASDKAVNQELDKLQEGKSKFELEGVATAVDPSAKTVTVKIKSSTDTIKEMRLSETPIIVSDSTLINSGDKENLELADIPINSQIHVAGTIKDGVLTATKIIIQKEDVDEANTQSKVFEIGGSVKEVKTDTLTITVVSASKKANSQKGKDLVVKVISSTIIEKKDGAIILSDVKVNDQVQVEGLVENDVYTATKIEVKVEEEGTAIQETSSTNQNSNQNSNQNVNKNSNITTK